MSTILCITLAGCLWASSGLASPAPATPRREETPPAARSAAEILAEVDRLGAGPLPDRARQKDPAYAEEYQAEREAFELRIAELASELARVAPDHERLQLLMAKRFVRLSRQGAYPEMEAETRDLLARTKNPAVSGELLYWRTGALWHLHVQGAQLGDGELVPFEAVMDCGRIFWTEHADDPRCPEMMVNLADALPMNSEEQRTLLEQVTVRYPNGPEARQAASLLVLLSHVGEVVELEFDDFMTGRRVALSELRGKVVVIDFWATWSVPNVQNLPDLKAWYERFKEQGVEFLGVSLDAPESEGGRAQVEAFLREHDVPWPQFYQGNGWESEFSSAWGIDSIPALFVVDQDGKLHHPQARGKLGTILPRLLREE